MDWYPLWNSMRIAAISTVIVFFLGILAAYYIAKLPRVLKGILDVILTLPLVLPPTVVGYLLLCVLGPRRTIGAWVLDTFGIRLVMTWWSAIFATIIVIFPLMYRTARGAFESFDETLAYSGQTLGMSNTRIFWRIRMPRCRQGILAGTVLAFARALGEYGATSMVRLYPRKDGDYLHNGLSAVENKRRRPCLQMGNGQYCHLRRCPSGGKPFGEKRPSVEKEA